MKVIELERAPLEGEFNINCFVADYQGHPLLQRNPKDNPRILNSIAHEYHFLGFTDLGGKFRQRNPQEQFKFCRYAASQGLRVLAPAHIDNANRIYYPFLIKAQALDEFLPTAQESVAQVTIYQLFEDLHRAHSKNIVYGDRWSQNMLILPNYGLIHIDFDIEISGSPAIELEVSQAAYYSLCGGRDKVLPLLAELLARSENWFNFNLVDRFLSQHAIHFRHSLKYGGAEKDTSLLLELVRRKKR